MAQINRTPAQASIARRIAIRTAISNRRISDRAVQPTIKMAAPNSKMLAACVEAAGFGEHSAY